MINSIVPKRAIKLRPPIQKDILHFTKIVGESNVIWSAATAEPKTNINANDSLNGCKVDIMAGYNVDWTGKYKGNAKCAVRPGNVGQVSAILKYCNEQGIGVVPFGGNTGLVGGAIGQGK